MDIGGWLRGLGLGVYEGAFRDNAIDDTILPTLTAEDLKDLGVTIVGHRRKLLNAIGAPNLIGRQAIRPQLGVAHHHTPENGIGVADDKKTKSCEGRNSVAGDDLAFAAMDDQHCRRHAGLCVDVECGASGGGSRR